MNLINQHNAISFTIWFTLMFLVNLANSEMFTALAEMEELLETEAVLISNLESYITAQEEKLDFLRR